MHAEQYLTTYELNEIDPSGRARSHIQQLKGSPYRIKGNIFIEKINPEKIFGILRQDINKLTASKRFYKYAMWVLPTFEKVGPQGGRYEYSTLLKSLEEYYTPRVVTPSEIAERGLQLLLRAIREVKQTHADATWSYQHVPVMGTSAGLPSMSKKGQYFSETTVEPGIRHLLGAVPGERVLKGKPRTIFMDANGNIRMIEDILGYVRAWLKRWLPQFFTGWKNPDHGLRQMITDGLLRGYKNFETDQTSMDQHFSKSIVELYIAPIYEAILPPDDFIVFQEYVSECFEQKLFMGDRFWTGLHNLFSGIGPTNEFETVFQLLIFLGGLDLVIPASPFHIAVNGDDVGLLVKATDAELHDLYSAILTAFKDCDFEISEAKK